MFRYQFYKRFRYGLLCLIWMSISVFHGGAADQLSLSRDEAILLAFKSNRPLRIVSLEVARAKSKLRWSGRLDNPELELSGSGDGIGLDEDESVYEIAISQRFPLTSRLKDEKHLRRHQVILADAEIAERRRELAGEVDVAIVQLLSTRRKITLQGELVTLNNKIVGFLKGRAKVGEASILDVTQATISGRTLEQQVKTLETQEKQQTIALNRILGVEAGTSITLVNRIDLPGKRPDEEHNAGDILSRRPDHVLALAKIDEADAAVALENAKRWEDVSVKLFLEREKAVDDPNGLERNTFAGVGISIPLPLRNKNQNGIETAQINRKAAEKGVDAAQFQIRSEYEAAYQQRIDTWELARSASGELLDLAENNLEEFRKAQQQGQASLLQVQQAQEQVLQLKNASLDLTTQYHLAAAKLRKAIGAYPGLDTAISRK